MELRKLGKLSGKESATRSGAELHATEIRSRHESAIAICYVPSPSVLDQVRCNVQRNLLYEFSMFVSRFSA